MSVFRAALMSMGDIGLYDIILPFFLIFTIVYAMLEKTKIFGLEKIGDMEVSRKNLNAMVAFVVAFFVIASTQLVAIIHEFVANLILILLLIVFFLLLVGSFQQDDGKPFYLQGTWNKAFMIISFIGIALVFLHTMGWLPLIWSIIMSALTFNSELLNIAVFIIIIVIAIMFITKTPASQDKQD